MKNRIFMYLFIFSVLLIVFQYVNAKNIHEDSTKKIEYYKEKIPIYKDSIVTLQDQVFGLSEFSLANSEEALTYLEQRGFNANDFIALIEDNLYELNLQKGNEHPLIPYASMNGGKMLINSIRLLNHKWIITNFSDGKYWGEMFLEYEITEQEELKFRLVKSFLYPVQ